MSSECQRCAENQVGNLHFGIAPSTKIQCQKYLFCFTLNSFHENVTKSTLTFGESQSSSSFSGTGNTTARGISTLSDFVSRRSTPGALYLLKGKATIAVLKGRRESVLDFCNQIMMRSLTPLANAFHFFRLNLINSVIIQDPIHGYEYKLSYDLQCPPVLSVLGTSGQA